MTQPDLMAELAALKETLATMAKFAPLPGTLCAPTMQMKLGWDAKSLLSKIDAHHAELEAAVRDAKLWRRHLFCQGRGHTHQCKRCGLAYTPAAGESEDCPACGFDGRDQAMHNSAREG